MANNAYTQQALAVDPRFRIRLKNALANVAWDVIGEDPNTEDHAEREAFARVQVLGNLDGITAQVSASIVTRPGVFAFDTSYDFVAGAVVTLSGDPDIEAQLATDWNDLAGID